MMGRKWQSDCDIKVNIRRSLRMGLVSLAHMHIFPFFFYTGINFVFLLIVLFMCHYPQTSCYTISFKLPTSLAILDISRWHFFPLSISYPIPSRSHSQICSTVSPSTYSRQQYLLQNAAPCSVKDNAFNRWRHCSHWESIVLPTQNTRSLTCFLWNLTFIGWVV